MRIGLSTNSIEPGLRGHLNDGIGHYTLYLYEELRKAGHDVDGYAYPPLTRRRPPLEYGHYLPLSLPVMAAAASLCPSVLRRWTPDCDIFHATDFKVMPLSVPVVATVFDAIPLSNPEWLSGRIRYLAPFLLRRLVPNADHIITASRHAAREIRTHFGIAEENISVVPWGIDPKWLVPPHEAERRAVLARYGLEPGYLLNVGTIQPRKNIGILLDAYMLLPAHIRAGHRLVIVGRFGWGSPTLMERLETMSARGEIVWLRNVESDDDVRVLYSEAHAFVLPSLGEGFGIPLLEAFASGVPAIAADRSSLPEVSNGAALLVDPENAGAIAAAIQHLLADEGDRREHIRLGLERARELDMASALEKTIGVYHQVLAMRR